MNISTDSQQNVTINKYTQKIFRFKCNIYVFELYIVTCVMTPAHDKDEEDINTKEKTVQCLRKQNHTIHQQ